MHNKLMTRCEQKKLFIKNGKKLEEWVEVDVSGLSSGTNEDIRCKHCRGSVRVHVKKVPHGPADHVEHLSHQDSENCRGGVHFKGTHRLSLQPVL